MWNWIFHRRNVLRDGVLSAGLVANPLVGVVTFVLLEVWAVGGCEPSRQYRNQGDKDVRNGRLQVSVVADKCPGRHNDRFDDTSAIPNNHY